MIDSINYLAGKGWMTDKVSNSSDYKSYSLSKGKHQIKITFNKKKDNYSINAKIGYNLIVEDIDLDTLTSRVKLINV